MIVFIIIYYKLFFIFYILNILLYTATNLLNNYHFIVFLYR